MAELIKQLVGERILLLCGNGRMETGTLRGVGEGLICLDVDTDGRIERVFYSIAQIAAFRVLSNEG